MAEENNSQLRALLGQQENLGRQQASDLNKANDIIRKMQDELKALKHRARSAEASLKQQEKLLRDSQLSNDSCRTELQELRTQLAEKTRLLVEVETEKAKAASELDEARKMNEANEKVIEWLHHQINDESLELIATRGYNEKQYNKQDSPILGDLHFPGDDWLGKGRSAAAVGSSSTSPPDFV